MSVNKENTLQIIFIWIMITFINFINVSQNNKIETLTNKLDSISIVLEQTNKIEEK